MSRDTITVRDLLVDCIVGTLPHERDREQPVRLNIEMGLNLARAGRSGRISDTVNYDVVAREVAALLRFRAYRLIEMAVEEVAAMALGVHRSIETIAVTLEKPRALEGRAAAAVVQARRTREDYPPRFETTKFGRAEVLLETREAGLYLLHVEPGRSIPLHHHQVMRELEWLVEGELFQGNTAVVPTQPSNWPHGRVHGYQNRSGALATLFCCDTPPFMPRDEIEVESAE